MKNERIDLQISETGKYYDLLASSCFALWNFATANEIPTGDMFTKLVEKIAEKRQEVYAEQARQMEELLAKFPSAPDAHLDDVGE